LALLKFFFYGSNPLIFFLQAAGGGSPGSAFSPIFLMVILFAIFYFLVIRPANTKRKKLQDMIQNLKNGEKVITNGGIYGTIAGIGDDHFIIKVDDKTKLKISKNAVAGKQPPEAQ
jgi:preprotein translocase subunit YajC